MKILGCLWGWALRRIRVPVRGIEDFFGGRVFGVRWFDSLQVS